MVFWLEPHPSKSRHAGTRQYRLTVDQSQPLHDPSSVFAGKLMSTEAEVLKLRELSKVSAPSLVVRLIYNDMMLCSLIWIRKH